jgi:hypothetical protein
MSKTKYQTSDGCLFDIPAHAAEHENQLMKYAPIVAALARSQRAQWAELQRLHPGLTENFISNYVVFNAFAMGV